MTRLAFLMGLTFLGTQVLALRADEPLFVAKPLTPEKAFTPGIEGPATDAAGFLYAVNFEKQGTIGKMLPDGSKPEIFVTLPKGSVGNGLRFDRRGQLYVADYTGQIWKVSTDGKISRVAEGLGTSNGVEVSPDEKTLYVNESIQRKIWAFDIAADGSLTNKRLFKEFPDFGFDGMRCDVAGNLYVTRHGKGTVVKISSTGETLKEIDVLGKMPTNLCFGGPDGKTVYVTEVEKQRVVAFRVDESGREWSLWRDSKP